MSSNKKDSSKKEHPFVDKFDITQKHPLFRSEEESRNLVYNMEAPKENEPVTNEYKDPMSGFKPLEYRV